MHLLAKCPLAKCLLAKCPGFNLTLCVGPSSVQKVLTCDIILNYTIILVYIVQYIRGGGLVRVFVQTVTLVTFGYLGYLGRACRKIDLKVTQ